MTSHWMCAMASQINLATRCGAPRERNGQFRALWCEPPPLTALQRMGGFPLRLALNCSLRRLLAARHYTSGTPDDLGVLRTI